MPIPEKIQTAIDALNAVDADDIKALDDGALRAFYGAICGPATTSEFELDLRRWALRRETEDSDESADTQWPDALEAA
jgi:hypothetical protein